jgi:hypothetical protein
MHHFNGVRGQMDRRQFVILSIAGSIPVDHPKLRLSAPFRKGVLLDRKVETLAI